MLTPLRISLAACAASVASLTAVSVGMSRPDGMIERSYAQGFDRLDSGRQIERHLSPIGASTYDPTHLQLSRFAGSAGPKLAIGDRITLNNQSGGAAAYEVVEVRPLPSELTGEGHDARPKLLLVTALRTGGGRPAEAIRLVVDADAPAPSVSTGTPHSL